MASYATVDNLKSLYMNMNFGAADNISTTKAQEALDGATAIINGYIGKITTVPVTEPLDLPLMKRLCVYIAANDVDGILNVRQMSKGDRNQCQGKIREIYEEAMDILKQIQKNEFFLESAKNISRVSTSEADMTQLDEPDAYVYGDGTG